MSPMLNVSILWTKLAARWETDEAGDGECCCHIHWPLLSSEMLSEMESGSMPVELSERTRFEVGRVDGFMVIFLLKARRRMIDQWDSRDLMFSETYNGKNQQAKSSFVAVVHS